MNTIIEMCFLCTKDYNCVPVEDRVVSQIEYLLPEITIINLGVALRICSVCEGALDAFSKFKHFCVENSRRLESSIRARGAPGPPLHTGRAPVVGHNDTSDTQPEKIEAVYIKEEPLEETWPECHPHINSAFPQEELREMCTTPDSPGAPKTVHVQSNTTGPLLLPILLQRLTAPQNKTHKNEESPNIKLYHNTNSYNAENITIKEEQLEQTTQDREIYSNIQKEEYVGMNDKNNKQKKYRCKICNITFANTAQLVRHKRKLNCKIKKLSCAICKKTFIHKYDLNTHMELHNGIKFFRCPICKKKFLEKQNFKRHLKLHNEQTDFRCDKCNDTFVLESDLISHLQKHVKKQIKGPFQCSKCKLVFKFKSKYNRHTKVHSDIPEFECDICGKLFRWKTSLYMHKKLHPEARNFPCDICKKTFVLPSDLNQHMKLHSIKKDFECYVCHKIFASCSLLNRHKKYHTDRRDFQCTLCYKSFKLRSHLTQHTKTHSKVKDFHCHICAKPLASKAGLEYHVKTHAGIKDIQCDVCSKTFRQTYQLKAHMKTHSEIKKPT